MQIFYGYGYVSHNSIHFFVRTWKQALFYFICIGNSTDFTMLLERLISFAKRFEDPMCSFLGPNVKGLHFVGLLQGGRSRLKIIIYNTFYATEVLFVTCQFIQCYIVRQDINRALQNLPKSTTNGINCVKSFSFIVFQSSWLKLIDNIAHEETTRNKDSNPKTLQVIKTHTKYARKITYAYWIAVLMTLGLLLSAPVIMYVSHRKAILNGDEPYILMLDTWFPFDEFKMPGNFFAWVVHFIMIIQGAIVVVSYDAIAVVIMCFMKCQLVILRNKCADIFENETNDQSLYLARIKECHRHHNFLIKQYKLFDSLVSPVSFLYVLVCSVSICASVVQVGLSDSAPSENLWAVEYTCIQLFQLIMFCWHANEVYVESKDVDRGIYASDWWKADVRVRKHVLLLACKLDNSLQLNAGPFADLSVPTFLNIIKGAYSFYTLLSQFQE